MSDEIKIPNDLLRKCAVVDVGVASQIIACWMREAMLNEAKAWTLEESLATTGLSLMKRLRKVGTQ